MSVRISGAYLGRKRCELVHEPSGTKLITDAPKDNQGEGSSFSPTDLLATSLVSCIMTTMAIVADRDGVELSGSTFEIEKIMNSDPRRIGKLPIIIRLPKGIDPEYRKKLERVSDTCPVSKSIHSEIEVVVEFRYEI